MKEFGFYDLHNDFSINIDTELSETDTTMFHEMTHMLVTLQSGYGNFLRRCKKSETKSPSEPWKWSTRTFLNVKSEKVQNC